MINGVKQAGILLHIISILKIKKWNEIHEIKFTSYRIILML